MNNISSVVEKITRGTKSGEKAREIVANFFKENNEDINWEFIVTFHKKIQCGRVGRRAKKKIAQIEEEILDYICSDNETENAETDDMFKEVIDAYGSILIFELGRKITEDGDIPLALIPMFFQHPEVLVILNESGIKTLKELEKCEQSILMELFRYNNDTLSEIVVMFKPMGIEFNVAHA